MKFVVTWYDPLNEREERVEGSKTFSELLFDNVQFWGKVDNIVENWEDENGLCLDRGGDSDFFEMDIADLDPDDPVDPNKIQKLLNDLDSLV